MEQIWHVRVAAAERTTPARAGGRIGEPAEATSQRGYTSNAPIPLRIVPGRYAGKVYGPISGARLRRGSIAEAIWIFG